MIPLPTLGLPAKLLVGLVGALMLLCIGIKIGYDYADGQAARAELEARNLADAQAKKLRHEVDTLSLDLAAQKAAQRPKDRIINREVVRYETLQPDRRCTLDGAWRMLHDAAATGDPATAARAFTDRADPVADATALETVAGNYEACREWRADLIGWQRWWRSVSGME